MAEFLELGADPAGAPLSIEDVARVAREGAEVRIGDAARARIARGRERLEELLARGERIYGVNTGVGGNVGISLPPEQMDLLQHNLVRHLACATGQPLPGDVVRAATLLRVATFATGASAVRPELVDALAALLNRGVTPVVPRYGSVGASGDLMPSAYIARVLVGLGEAEFQGRRLAAAEALEAAGIAPIRFAPKEGLALINGTTVMTAVASLVWMDAFRVLRALLGAVALAVEAMQAPDLPFEPWVHERKGHPGQIAVAAYLRGMLEGSAYTQPSGGQSCYSLRCVPQGLGQVWEALEDARAVIEREINSANDNPLIDPETGGLYKAGQLLRRPHRAPAGHLEDRLRLHGQLGQRPGGGAGGRPLQRGAAGQPDARAGREFRIQGHAVERHQPGLRGAADGRSQLDPLAAHRAIQPGRGEPGNARGGHGHGRAGMPAQRDGHGAAGRGAGRGSARRAGEAGARIADGLRSRAATGAVPGSGPAHGARGGGGIGQDRGGAGLAATGASSSLRLHRGVVR